MKDFYYRYLNKFKGFVLNTLFKHNIIIRNCEILADGTINVNSDSDKKFGFVMYNTLIGCTISCETCGANILDKNGDHIDHECIKGE